MANIQQLSSTQNVDIHCVIQSLSAFIVLPSLVNSHTKQICKDGKKYYTHSHCFSTSSEHGCQPSRCGYPVSAAHSECTFGHFRTLETGSAQEPEIVRFAAGLGLFVPGAGDHSTDLVITGPMCVLVGAERRNTNSLLRPKLQDSDQSDKDARTLDLSHLG